MTSLRGAPVDALTWEAPENDIDEALVCRQIVPVTHDVTSFVLASPTGRDFVFDAGQYLTVAATPLDDLVLDA